MHFAGLQHAIAVGKLTETVTFISYWHHADVPWETPMQRRYCSKLLPSPFEHSFEFSILFAGSFR